MSFTLTAGQLDAIRREVQENYYKRAQIAPTIMNISGSVAPGAKSVALPTISAASMADKVKGTDLTDAGFTLDTDVLNLDKNKAIYSKVEDRSELQTVPNLGASLVREFSKAWVDQLEQDVADTVKATVAAGQKLQLSAATNTEITQGDILDAKKILEDRKVPRSDRYLAISTNQESVMLAISDFVRADSYGDPRGLKEGVLGRIYGFNVILANSFADDEVLAYHMDHAAWASQQTPKFEKDRDLKALSDEYALSMLYGIKVLRGGIYGVKLDSSVPA